jgi:predicted AAA+ superfamily ATPase
VLYVNFDDPVFMRLITDTGGIETLYRDYLKLKAPKGIKYLLFDEIQNVPNWEKWIKAAYDMEESIFHRYWNEKHSGFQVFPGYREVM